jgi:hypothetical protein
MSCHGQQSHFSGSLAIAALPGLQKRWLWHLGDMPELGFRTPFDELHERVAGLKEDGGQCVRAGRVNVERYMIKELCLAIACHDC